LSKQALLSRIEDVILNNSLSLIKYELELLEAGIESILAEGKPETVTLREHILQAAGKRLRPALFFLASDGYAGNVSQRIDVAVSLELIHTASLLHDDVIDQAVIRRGKDTTHVKWNNKISVLTGDYLLSRSFQLIAATRRWALVDIVTSLVQDMTEGEIEQSFAHLGNDDLEEQYFSWIGKKTASFFAGCCQAGSLFAGNDDHDQAIWYEFGYNFGLAYQLVDDYLDYSGKAGSTGKPVFGDLKNGVITLPLLKSIKLPAGSLSNSRALKFSETGSEMQQTAQLVLGSKGPEYTALKAKDYADKARSVLKNIQAVPEIKNELENLISVILRRCSD